MSRLYLKQMELGPMQNYIYVLGDAQTREVVVVDPAWDVSQIEQTLKEQNLKLKAALITHGHPDHTNGIEDLLQTHDIPVYVSRDEASFYKPVGENIRDVAPGDTLQVGQIELTFLHTPGHTPGSQCFLVEGNLVSGDTLFLDGCGRSDLPGGDAETLYDSLYNRLMKLPANTVIYPGHNYHHHQHDSLENQCTTNLYLTCSSLQEFLNLRMGL